MKLMRHIGLHKTGTTSIQETLYKRPIGEGVRYFPWRTANHSALIRLLFDDDLDKHYYRRHVNQSAPGKVSN